MSVASELQTYLSAAAATVTVPSVATVRPGEPDTVNVPVIAYWYTGTKTWQANTFSKTQELSCWHVRVYGPVGPRFTPIDGGVEGWLESVVDAVRGQLWGHYSLDGAATGTGASISDATAGWAQVGAQLCRIADMDFEAMQTAVHDITA